MATNGTIQGEPLPARGVTAASTPHLPVEVFTVMSPGVANAIDTNQPRAADHPASSIQSAVFRLDGPIIITIDGPAGTGKSTVARSLAKRLRVDFLDTGAMYRAAAALEIDRRVTSYPALVDLVKQANIRFNWKADPPDILAFGKSLGSRIRDKDVTARVSPVSAIHDLRELMVQLQRQIAVEHPRLVTEGRDQGSVVFPDATVKFYLDADPSERARRRVDQLKASGRVPVSITQDEVNKVLAEIVERDQRDRTRPDGPLTQPEGAIVIDTTYLSQDEVIAELERVVRSRAALTDA
jgi:CMP/dCMP kinase